MNRKTFISTLLAIPAAILGIKAKESEVPEVIQKALFVGFEKAQRMREIDHAVKERLAKEPIKKLVPAADHYVYPGVLPTETFSRKEIQEIGTKNKTVIWSRNGEIYKTETFTVNTSIHHDAIGY